MNPYFAFPFLFELIYDWIAIGKGKKDLHWLWRIPMFLLTAVDYSTISLQAVTFYPGAIILCLVPYTFFDNFLNLLRFRSWKKWEYLQQRDLNNPNPKLWDSILRNIPEIVRTPLRALLAIGIIWVAYLIR